MSEDNPIKVFFSPENVTTLYKTIQIYLKKNHNTDIGREYLEQLINIMKLVVKPIKKIPKDVDQTKYLATLNKRTLAEAIPIFTDVASTSNLSRTLASKINENPSDAPAINTQGFGEISHLPPRPMSSAPEHRDQLSTPISQLRRGMAGLPPSASAPSSDPDVIEQVMQQAQLQDPRLYNSPDELFDIINQQRQESVAPSTPNFTDPQQEYPNNIDDLYAQAETMREQTDIITAPDIKQLPFQIKEDFKVRKAPTHYTAKPNNVVSRAIEKHSPHREHFDPSPNKTQIPMDTTMYSMSTSIEDLRNRQGSYTAGTVITQPDNAMDRNFDPEKYRDMVPRIDRSIKQPKDIYDYTNLVNPMNGFSDVAPQPEEMRLLIPETSRNLVNDSRLIPIIVSIDSLNKDETESDNKYRIDINDIKEVLAIELLDAQIPITEYVVNDSNNVLYFEEVNGTTLIAELTPGNYTPDELATEIANQLTATSSAYGNSVTYTATANTMTGKFTITSMAIGPLIFDLLFFGGTETYGATQPEFRKERPIYLPRSAGNVLGFLPTDLTGSFDYTSQNRWNLNGEPYIWLFIKEAETIESMDPHQRKAFAKIVLNEPLGSVKYYTHHIDGAYIKHYSPPIGKLAHFTVEFRKRNGDLYDFNGHSNSLTFRLISKDITRTPY